MYLCPNCRTEFSIDGDSCGQCGWSPELVSEIQVFLSNSDLSDSFFGEYIENYKTLSVEDMDHGIVNSQYLENQADKTLMYCSDVSASSILEVGVGQGFLIRKLKDAYPKADLTAVDISIPYLKKIMSLGEVECLMANAENLPFLEHFDLLIASDILEHVINPIDFLLSASYSLRQNGYFILRVPNEDNMLQYSRLLGCKHRFAHLRNFSKRNLLIMLQQAGFSIERVHYDGFYIYQKRKWASSGWLGEKIDQIIDKNYPDPNDVSRIPSWLGKILMRPLEIVVVAKKERNVNSMNWPIYDT